MSDDEKLLKFIAKHTKEEESSGSALGIVGTARIDELRKKRARKQEDKKFYESVDAILKAHESDETREAKIDELLNMMIKKSKLDVDMKEEVVTYVKELQKNFKAFYAREKKVIESLKKQYRAKIKILDESFERLEQAILEALSSQNRLEQSIALHNLAIEEVNKKIHEYNDKAMELNAR